MSPITLIKSINPKEKADGANDEGREAETVIRLARVGYDFTIGYLKGGIEAWKADGRELEHIISVNPNTLADLMQDDSHLHILDVRKKSEYFSEHLIGAENAPLDF